MQDLENAISLVEAVLVQLESTISTAQDHVLNKADMVTVERARSNRLSQALITLLNGDGRGSEDSPTEALQSTLVGTDTQHIALTKLLHPNTMSEDQKLSLAAATQMPIQRATERSAELDATVRVCRCMDATHLFCPCAQQMLFFPLCGSIFGSSHAKVLLG
jgi:hypothetical protein